MDAAGLGKGFHLVSSYDGTTIILRIDLKTMLTWHTSIGLLSASSVQIAFYLETGSEIKWGSAGKFAHDWEGLKVLLSGMVPAFFISVSIAVIARISTQPLCKSFNLFQFSHRNLQRPHC